MKLERSVGAGPSGTFWAMVRRKEGGCSRSVVGRLSLGLVLWVVLSPLHPASQTESTACSFGFCRTGGALLTSLHQTHRRGCQEVCVDLN